MKTYELAPEQTPGNPNNDECCWDVRMARQSLVVAQVIERHWYDARNKAARILGEADIMRLDVTPAANQEWHAYS
jgi:hypothetical protein